MNWVDIVLIGTLVAGGLAGMWVGMIRGSCTVIGVIVGLILVAQFREDAASLLANYLANEGLVTILSYFVVISATILATGITALIVRKLAYGMLMGWADRLAGMAAGLAVGAVLTAAVILGMSGLSNSKSALDERVPGKILDYAPLDANDLDDLEARVNGSPVVSFLLSAADLIPDKARDLAPIRWRDALENLEDRLEGIETARR